MKVYSIQQVKFRHGSLPRPPSPALLLPLVLLLSACDTGTSTETLATPLRVNVAPAHAAAGYAVGHRFSGRVETARSAALGFELGGRIAEVRVDEGDEVLAGDVLARLDTERLRAGRRELAAALEEARSQFSLAEKTLARVEEAIDYRGVSTQQLDQARGSHDRAKAAVELAAARVASLDVDIAKSELIAPFAGTVARRELDEGTVVQAGAPLLRLEETAHLRARVGVAGELTADLEPGQRHVLIGPHGPLPAVIAAVAPVRDRVTRTVDVLFDLLPSARDGGARAGDLVEFELREFRDDEGYWLPLAALSEGERGTWSVLVTARADAGDEADYRIARRLVEVIHHEGERVFVTGGISPQDLLVVDGTHRVVVGQRVRPSASDLAGVEDALPHAGAGEALSGTAAAHHDGER
jgi:RND family efflux transporter MFP subunit